MKNVIDRFEAGMVVEVTQQVPQRSTDWTVKVRGTVVVYEQRPTGSWFAHAKGDKLWLDRLILRRDDGEIVTCVLDRFSRVERVG